MKLENKYFITLHESQQNTQWDSFTHQKRGLYHLSRTHGQKGLLWHFLHHKIQLTVCCVFVLHIALLTHEFCHVKWPMWYAYTVHCTRACLWPWLLIIRPKAWRLWCTHALRSRYGIYSRMSTMKPNLFGIQIWWYHIPKKAHSKKGTFQKEHIRKMADSKQCTFENGRFRTVHIPKKQIPEEAHSKKGTFQKEHIPKKAHSQKHHWKRFEQRI